MPDQPAPFFQPLYEPPCFFRQVPLHSAAFFFLPFFDPIQRSSNRVSPLFSVFRPDAKRSFNKPLLNQPLGILQPHAVRFPAPVEPIHLVGAEPIPR